MMSLSQLHEKISALSTLNEDAVHEGIADIFYYLLYGDQQFYTVTASGLPIASATSSDTAHRYLRLFSHQELADKRAARSEGVSVQTVSALESVKLAKSGLMAGIYGYVLNEGDKWIAIPLAEYLSIFCARILKEPDMFCQECAELVLFIGELRNKEPTRFFAVCDDSGGWAVFDETCFILPDDCPVPDTLNNCELRPVTDSLLADISSNSVCIKIEKGDLVVSRELLSAARCYCRFGDEDSDSILSNWHSHSHDIESLSLVFSPELDEPTELPKAEEDTSDKDMESNAVLPLTWAHKIAAIASGFATKIRTKIKAACPAAKMLSSNSPALDSDVPVVQEEGSGEAVGEQSEDLCRRVRGSMKKKHVVLTSSVCCVLIFLLVAAIGIRRYQYQQRFDQFCTYVDDRD